MKNLLMLIICISFGLCSILYAQDSPGKICLSGFAGFAFPMGDLADDDVRDNDESMYRTVGPQFGASFDYFFTSNFGAGLQFKYVSLPSKDWDILDEPDQDDVMTFLQFEARGKYVFIPYGSIRPYGKFGFGLVMTSVSDFPAILPGGRFYVITDVEVDTRFYFELGAGLMFFVSPQVSIYGELNYDYLMLDGAETKLTDVRGDPEGEVDINPYYIGLIAGLNVWFSSN